MSRRITIHPVSPQQRLLDQAVAALHAGELVVYPTDSGYALGFAMDARDALERVVRLRHLKPRHNFTPACRDLKQIGHYARVDDSHKHAGHAGARDGRGHFSVRVVAGCFRGLRPVARHRLGYDAAGDLLETDIHALSIQALSPEELT